MKEVLLLLPLEKSNPIVGMWKSQEMESSMANKDVAMMGILTFLIDCLTNHILEKYLLNNSKINLFWKQV